MKCTKCNYEANYYEFISDYHWDDESTNEVPVFKCPNCGNDDEDEIIEVE